MSSKRPEPLSRTELKKILDSAIKSGAYIETFHARFDHVERQIDLNDVLYGLQRPDWKLGSPPRFDKEFWSWEYTVRTMDLEGSPLTIVISVDSRNKSFEVITRWSES